MACEHAFGRVKTPTTVGSAVPWAGLLSYERRGNQVEQKQTGLHALLSLLIWLLVLTREGWLAQQKIPREQGLEEGVSLA